MKCGIGKAGRCTLGPIYAAKRPGATLSSYRDCPRLLIVAAFCTGELLPAMYLIVSYHERNTRPSSLLIAACKKYE